jgi:dUTP pyrophosphatase
MAIQCEIIDARVSPVYATAGSAGMDLFACVSTPVMLAPGETYLMSTGIKLHIGSTGYAGLILPRSGLGHTRGIVLGNSVGLIDSDYKGELKVSVWNRNRDEWYTIQPMDRIAQLIIVPIAHVALQFVAGVNRGEGGFGSTGS